MPRPLSTTRLGTVLLSLGLALFSQTAHAHVKWFSPFDTSEAPLAWQALFAAPGFFLIGIASLVAVFITSFMDSYTLRINQGFEYIRSRLLSRLPSDFAYLWLRYALIVFFTCIWVLGDVILTPELKHSNILISGLHVVMILALMTARTAKLAGAGIIVLWFYAASRYGVFHLSDYMIFLGIAIFMLIGNAPNQRQVNATAFLILYAGISATLQWASVEKWVYPQWSYPLLEKHPYLTLGIDNEIFMIIAGYVEFTLAFLLIATTASGFIVTTLGLALVFVLAVIGFGKIDAIGHLAIVVGLVLMAVKGPSRINLFFANLHPGPVRNALSVTGIYLVSVCLFTGAYYALFYSNEWIVEFTTSFMAATWHWLGYQWSVISGL